MTKYDKESVYDAEIAPLMKQVMNICKRENLPMTALFHLKEERNDAEYENQALRSIYLLIPDKSSMNAEHHEDLRYVADAMKYGKNGKPVIMTGMIKTT